MPMDTATSDIRAVEFTPSSDGDSPVLPELLDQIPEGEEIGTVTADGAYDTRRCHTAIMTYRPLRSSRSARTGGRGKRTARPRSPETKLYAPLATTAGRSGSAGQDTTPEVGSRPRCAASKPSVNASRQETPTARLNSP